MTQDNPCRLVGASHTWVALTCGRADSRSFETRGLIQRHRARIWIPDLAALASETRRKIGASTGVVVSLSKKQTFAYDVFTMKV